MAREFATGSSGCGERTPSSRSLHTVSYPTPNIQSNAHTTSHQHPIPGSTSPPTSTAPPSRPPLPRIIRTAAKPRHQTRKAWSSSTRSVLKTFHKLLPLTNASLLPRPPLRRCSALRRLRRSNPHRMHPLLLHLP